MSTRKTIKDILEMPVISTTTDLSGMQEFLDADGVPSSLFYGGLEQEQVAVQTHIRQYGKEEWQRCEVCSLTMNGVPFMVAVRYDRKGAKRFVINTLMFKEAIAFLRSLAYEYENEEVEEAPLFMELAFLQNYLVS